MNRLCGVLRHGAEVAREHVIVDVALTRSRASIDGPRDPVIGREGVGHFYVFGRADAGVSDEDRESNVVPGADRSLVGSLQDLDLSALDGYGRTRGVICLEARGFVGGFNDGGVVLRPAVVGPRGPCDRDRPGLAWGEVAEVASEESAGDETLKAVISPYDAGRQRVGDGYARRGGIAGAGDKDRECGGISSVDGADGGRLQDRDVCAHDGDRDLIAGVIALQVGGLVVRRHACLID